MEDKPEDSFWYYLIHWQPANISRYYFTVCRTRGDKGVPLLLLPDDLEHALEVLDKNKERLTIKDITYNKDVAKLSVVGAEIPWSNPGVASQNVRGLYYNSKSIST